MDGFLAQCIPTFLRAFAVSTNLLRRSWGKQTDPLSPSNVAHWLPPNNKTGIAKKPHHHIYHHSSVKAHENLN
jgi:hypothetical protein